MTREELDKLTPKQKRVKIDNHTQYCNHGAHEIKSRSRTILEQGRRLSPLSMLAVEWSKG
jgi:hypothetical protein